MKAIELLEKYPLTTEVVRDWFITKMMESVNEDNDVPEDFKKFMIDQGVPNDRLCVFIDANPRSLFDVFDENDVIIIIKYHDNFGFTWAVEEADDQSFYKTRKEAELSSIDVAFDILENKLKPVSDDSDISENSEDN